MKIKISINSDNYVANYAEIGNIGNSVEIEIDDDTFTDFKSNFRCYKYEDSSIVLDFEKVGSETLEVEKKKARTHRLTAFQALDLYDKAVLRGDIQETEEEKIERDTFRQQWLAVPDNYTDIAIPIEQSYPIMPNFIEYFI